MSRSCRFFWRSGSGCLDCRWQLGYALSWLGLGWWCSVELASMGCHSELAWLVALASLHLRGISMLLRETLMGKSPREGKLKSPPIKWIELHCSSVWASRFSLEQWAATFRWLASLNSKLCTEVSDRHPLPR